MSCTSVPAKVPRQSVKPLKQRASNRYGLLNTSFIREGYESAYPYDDSGKMPGTGENPIPDPLIWLGFVAAHTTSLRLATGISLLPERSPITYAKEVATLDNMSGGRVELGIRHRLAQRRVQSAWCPVAPPWSAN